MPRRLLRAARTPLAPIAALAALGAAAPTAGAALRVREYKRTVEGTQIGRFIVNCPRGSVAAAGGVRALPPDAARVAGSVPLGRRSWRFRIDARTASAGVPVTVFVSCVDVPSPPRGYSVRFRPRTVSLPVSLAAQQSANLTLRCPRGYAPSGYGLELRAGAQAEQSAIGAAGDVRLPKARPVRGGMQIDVVNGGESTDITVTGRCMPREAVALRPRTRRIRRWRFAIARQTSRVGLAAGNNDNRRRRCRRGRALSTWHELRGDVNASVFTSFPDGRSGVWNIFSPSAERATLHLLCHRGGARWR